MKAALRLGLAGVAIGAFFIVLHVFKHRDSVVPSNTFVTIYEGSEDPLENILVLSDGQAFAALARDPGLNNPSVFADGPSEFGYRAKRPLYGYLTWAASMGRSDWVPEAMAVISALSLGLLTAAMALLLENRRVRAEWALAAVLVPGIYVSFPFLMPGALAAGLAMMGLAWWERTAGERDPTDLVRAGSSTLGPVLLFTLAVLTRETMIFFPAGLALFHLLNYRRFPSLWLATPLLAYAAWNLILSGITGVPVSGSLSKARTAAPFDGLVKAMKIWPAVSVDWFLAVLTLLLVVAALVWRRNDPLVTIAVVGVLTAQLMSVWVWVEWEFWTRAITPVHFAAGVALLTPTAFYTSSAKDGRQS